MPYERRPSSAAPLIRLFFSSSRYISSSLSYPRSSTLQDSTPSSSSAAPPPSPSSRALPLSTSASLASPAPPVPSAPAGAVRGVLAPRPSHRSGLEDCSRSMENTGVPPTPRSMSVKLRRRRALGAATRSSACVLKSSPLRFGHILSSAAAPSAPPSSSSLAAMPKAFARSPRRLFSRALRWRSESPTRTCRLRWSNSMSNSRCRMPSRPLVSRGRWRTSR